MVVIVKCTWCKNDFERRVADINKSKRLGRKIYCSNRCSTLASFASGTRKASVRKKEAKGRTVDIKCPFKELFRHIAGRCKKTKRECIITVDDLYNRWIAQRGICPYTGLQLSLDLKTQGAVRTCINRASVDRIDSSKGYTPTNIQFVAYPVNLAKSDFLESEFLDVCYAIANTFRDHR